MRWPSAALAVALLAGACNSDSPSPGAAACRPAPLRTQDTALDVANLVGLGPDGSVDTDGDGQDDVVSVDDGVTISRGDGHLRFPDAELRTSGDLDGDGRDDLVLHVGNDDFAVSGRTPTGEHEPAAAGVHLGPALTFIWADDLDGRRGVDFAQPVRDGGASHTTVWSGAAVLAKGPGGDARDLRPARTLPGLTRAVVALAPGTEPETVLLVPGESTSLRFARRPNVTLRTAWSASRVEDIVVFDEAGGRRIALVVDRNIAVWASPPRCR